MRSIDILVLLILSFWAVSSAGRALQWHCRGQRFDPATVHFYEIQKILFSFSRAFVPVFRTSLSTTFRHSFHRINRSRDPFFSFSDISAAANLCSGNSVAGTFTADRKHPSSRIRENIGRCSATVIRETNICRCNQWRFFCFHGQFPDQ